MSTLIDMDYYAILGVSRDATVLEINKAYKKLALKFHPDKAGDSARSVTEFRQIQEAVENLRDPTKRKKHNNDLHRNKRNYNSRNARFTTGRPAASASAFTWDDYFCSPPDFSTYFQSADEYEAYMAETDGKADNGVWTAREGDHPAFRDSQESYLYSWGWADHMNPNTRPRDAWAEAEEFQAQLDREEEERRQEEEEHIRIEKEEAARREMRRREGMEARVLRDECEEEQEETHEDLLFADHMEGYTALFQDSSTRAARPTKESISVNRKNSSLNVNGEPVLTKNDESKISESANLAGPCQERQDEGHHKDLQVFFRYKLFHQSSRYGVEDMTTEITGLVLESLQAWFAEIRELISSQRLRQNSASLASCEHLGPWTKSSIAGECERCHRWLPIFLLTCPNCGVQACVSCKYAT